MEKSRNRIWYDITMALTFPSVIGTVIYSILDTGVKQSLFKLFSFNNMIDLTKLDLLNTNNFYAMQSLGFSKSIGILIYLLLSLLIIIQYSCDYLYSKYFEEHYTFEHFSYDLLISLFLAISFISISIGVTGNLYLLRISFIILWFGLFLTYFVYCIWDFIAYRRALKSNHKNKKFYKSMVFWFEIVSGICFAFLAFITYKTKDLLSHNIEYVLICLIVVSLLSIWFFIKILQLEKLTRNNQLN